MTREMVEAIYILNTNPFLLSVHRFYLLVLEAATRSVLQEKVFLEISQNSQENICTRVFFLIKLPT